MSRHSAEADDTPWHAVGLLTSQNVTWWYQASASDIQDRGLLIRGCRASARAWAASPPKKLSPPGAIDILSVQALLKDPATSARTTRC